MKLQRNYWAWVCTVLCVPAMNVLADETEPAKPAAAPQGVLVKFDVQEVEVGGAEVKPPSFRVVRDFQRDDAQVETTLIDDLTALHQQKLEAEAQGKFWIGLMALPPSDALRTQLDLAADLGLLVEEVHEGSPAQKAGIQQHDLLLNATIAGKGEPQTRRLTSIADLVAAVQSAETGTVKLEFLRRGRKQSLDVVPAERPKAAAARFTATAPVEGHVVIQEGGEGRVITSSSAFGLRWAGPMILNTNFVPLPDGMTIEFHPAEGPPEKVTVKQGERTWEAEIKALDKLPPEIAVLVQQHLAARNAVKARTGFAYTTTAARHPTILIQSPILPLPDDVTVTTVRKGSEPAKVTIKRGDQSWEVTEKDLSKLPVELRPHAEMALTGRMGPPTPFTRAVPMAVPAPPGQANVIYKTTTRAIPTPTVTTTNAATLRNQRDIERQLKELAEQVEKLRQAVEKNQPKQ